MAVTMHKTWQTPGVYLESLVPEAGFVLETGVPVFVGLVRKSDLLSVKTVFSLTERPKAGVSRIEPLSKVQCGHPSGDSGSFPMFTTFVSVKEALGDLVDLGFLGSALRGFFENGGKKCFVHPLCYDESICLVHGALAQGLVDLEDLGTADLVCAPDLVWLYREDPAVSAEDLCDMQNRMLNFCGKNKRYFAVLDSLPGAEPSAVIIQRKKLYGDNGALYYPWLKTTGPSGSREQRVVPPCGHVCGIYARSDQAKGVHKAPANEEVQGVSDVEVLIENSEQDLLNPEHVNCIRSFPGRGIRVWGARTLSRYPEWTYVSVRRLFLTLTRWLDGFMTRLVFEPNDRTLWSLITREINRYLNSLFLAGALKGNSENQAFFVACDSRTNSRELRDQGFVVTEIGIAPALPCEFIIIRMVHSDSGTRIDLGQEDIPGQTGTGSGSTTPVPAAVVVAHIEYSVKGHDTLGEYVVIENRDSQDVELGNWTLTDRAGHVYTFPRFTLRAGSACRVWTREGADSQMDLFWGSRHGLWNNTGDQAILRDRLGHTVHVYTYVPRGMVHT